MVKTTAIIRNGMGIHCRPSAVIVKETRDFRGELEVIAPNGRCDPRSIMDLISLGLAEGTQIELRIHGRSEKKFAPKLVELFERHFDFPPDPASTSPLRKGASTSAA